MSVASCSSCHATADLCGGRRLASMVELRATGFVSVLCSVPLSPVMLATFKMPCSEEKVLCGLIMVGPVPQWVTWGWLASCCPGSYAAFLGHFVSFLQVEGPVVLSCCNPISACNTCRLAEVLLLCFPLCLYVCVGRQLPSLREQPALAHCKHWGHVSLHWACCRQLPSSLGSLHACIEVELSSPNFVA